MKKVLLVATVQSHIAQFHKPLIQMLKSRGYEIHIAARDNLKEKNGLELPQVDKIFDIAFSRSPINLGNVKAYKVLKGIIDREGYDIVHCNTPVGGVVARFSAISARKKGCKVFYTAHGFHFYQGASVKNWILYYPIEKILSKITDVLVTITNEDFKLAQKKFRCKVFHINGCGVDDNRFLSVSSSEVAKIKSQFNLEDKFIALCTGELNNNKNQKFLLDVMERLSQKVPNLVLILAGNGPNYEELKNFIKTKKLENNVLMVGYRSDIEKFVNACDIVVSASLREGLPFNIIEAMICNKPVVVSNNRGHRELIENNVNGFVFEHGDVEKCAVLIEKLYADEKLKTRLAEEAKCRSSLYTATSVQRKLEELYQ